jgi:predicted MFS family arabinose efflux permease
MGWSSPLVLAAVVVAAPLALAAFVARERRAPAPLLPLPLLARRNFSLPLLNEMLSGATYMGGFVLTPLLLRFVFGYSLSATAFLSLLRPVTFSLGSPLGARLALRIGERATAMAGAGLMVAGMGLFVVGALQQAVVVVCVANTCQGGANRLMRPSMLALITNEVDEESFGIAAATSRMVSQMGAAVGITLLTTLYGGTREAASFAQAYLAGLGLAIAAFVACTFVRSTPRAGAAGPAMALSAAPTGATAGASAAADVP